MDLAEREALRARYKPDKVNVLFVAESPPTSGEFFYTANSPLYFHTAAVFRRFFRRRVHGTDFLVFFMGLGCFLVDLSAGGGPDTAV